MLDTAPPILMFQLDFVLSVHIFLQQLVVKPEELRTNRYRPAALARYRQHSTDQHKHDSKGAKHVSTSHLVGGKTEPVTIHTFSVSMLQSTESSHHQAPWQYLLRRHKHVTDSVRIVRD